jgi:hypothetical protein
MRQHEAQRPRDMRRHRPQHLALLQRLTHEAELVVLEIAQAAVDQLGRGRRGAGREVILLAEIDRIAASRRFAGDAAAVDAAADDRDVDCRAWTAQRCLRRPTFVVEPSSPVRWMVRLSFD